MKFLNKLSHLNNISIMKKLSILVIITSLLTLCNGCLNLTPFLIENKPEVARTKSLVDPDKFLGITSHSGFLTVKQEFNSSLFFWYFPLKEEVNIKPWIIWLNGGPGVSSLMGLFDLVGPLKIENRTNVVLREITWTSSYSMVFIDSPVGAGFSYTGSVHGYVDNEDDVGDQLYTFVQSFLAIFPELRQAPLFIAGQSYAGKYIPALAIQIHKRKNDTHPINLRGLSIGNGMVDPRSMMHYSELLSALGLMDQNDISYIRQQEEDIIKLIDNKDMEDAGNTFNTTIEFIKSVTGVSIYNYDNDPNTAPTYIEAFLTQPDILEAIHATNSTFNLNNQLVYYKLLPDIVNSTLMWVEELLEHYGVMFYSGERDLIVPYSASRHAHSIMQWSRRDEYIKADRKRLRESEGGAVVGYKKSGGNFVDILVRRAGHNVPADQPGVAKFIIDSFIKEFV